jgi:hypothetical protein
MSTHGFIVGIEKYAEPKWDIEGPCLNAIAMASWLASIGVPGKNIHVFLAPSRSLTREIAALKRKSKGIDVRLVGDAESIETFWRTELTEDVPADSRLFAFWSGHGFTSKKRNRVFFCSDYQSKLPTRVFNETNFLNQLLTANFDCFSEQIVLGDVCGVYKDIPVTETSDDANLGMRQQLAYFATPEGSYAKGNDGRGVFTTVTIEVLTQINDWPAQVQFVSAMTERFAGLETQPFKIDGFSNHGQIREIVVGGNQHFRAVEELLLELDVVETVFRPHYVRTATALGIPELLRARDLRAAIRELASLGGMNAPKTIPAGLLQFLVRLSFEADLRAPIEEWLTKQASAQKNTLTEIRNKLQLESQGKVLMVITEVDVHGEITAYRPLLCSADYSILPDTGLERHAVRGWAAFEQSLQALLRPFVEGDHLSNLEIHFVAEPALFDRPFHLIPLAAKQQPIGEDAIVLVRHKQRMLSADQRLRFAWHERADALRETKPGAIKWLRVSLNNALPNEAGLCFACFKLSTPGKAKRTSRLEKDTLRRLLHLGIPYVYVPHTLDAGGWDKLEERLTALVRRTTTVGAFPSTMLEARIGGNKIATGGTLIWDDPMAMPIRVLESVRFG